MERIGDADRTEILPTTSPDAAVLDRAQVESATIGLFGARLVILRQPLRAAGARAWHSTAWSPSSRASRTAAPSRWPRRARRVTSASRRPRSRGSTPPSRRGAERWSNGSAPRRAELVAWIRPHAASPLAEIEPPAATLLAERVGGAVWETDVERGEQTRVADAELRKLATLRR